MKNLKATDQICRKISNEPKQQTLNELKLISPKKIEQIKKERYLRNMKNALEENRQKP